MNRSTATAGSPQPPPSRPWFRGNPALWPLLYAPLTALLLALIAWSAQHRPHYEVGQYLPQAVLARVAFRAVDQEQTERSRRDAQERQPAIYDPNPVFFRQARERLEALWALGDVSGPARLDQIHPQVREAFQLTAAALTELRRLHTPPSATPAPTDTPSPPTGTVLWQQWIDRLLDRLAGLPVLDKTQARAERDPAQRASKIVIRHPSAGPLEQYDDLILNLEDDHDLLAQRLTELAGQAGFPTPLVRSVAAAILQVQEPTYRLNELETRLAKQRAYEQQPPVERFFQVHDLIVPPGRILSTFDVQALVQEQRAFLATLSPADRWLAALGWLGLAMLLVTGLWVYILAYNPRIAANPTRGAALSGLMLLGPLLAVSLASLKPTWTLAGSAAAVLLVSIVVAIAYDQRLALVTGLIQTVLISLTLHMPLAGILVLTAGVAGIAGWLNEVRTRSKLLVTSAAAGLLMAASWVLWHLIQRQAEPLLLPQMLQNQALVLLGTALAVGMIVQSLLPGIERLFGVTTSLTLKELNDASHPLLRRLAQEAPGTYQHSLRLADLAEAAADAIGANALLCRVGAMYHDIGKLLRPDFFVENQGQGPNRHDSLDPRQSLAVILAHVRDGLILAREHRLPSPVRHMIESHHGTSLVEFFYHAACQQAERTGQPPPDPAEFRYPGPKPRSREAAILMLADSVESAARTLNEPTPQALAEVVDAAMARRMADGQLDQTPLTLSELHRIRSAFLHVLTAMYHSRIAYPSLSTASNSSPTPAPAGSPPST